MPVLTFVLQILYCETVYGTDLIGMVVTIAGAYTAPCSCQSLWHLLCLYQLAYVVAAACDILSQ